MREIYPASAFLTKLGSFGDIPRNIYPLFLHLQTQKVIKLEKIKQLQKKKPVKLAHSIENFNVLYGIFKSGDVTRNQFTFLGNLQPFEEKYLFFLLSYDVGILL